jgi:methionine-rich copper-binding protein CopC
MNPPMNRDYPFLSTVSLPILLALAAPLAFALPKPLPETGTRCCITATPDTGTAATSTNPFRTAQTSDAIDGLLLAHAILVKSYPDKEATITDVPEEILLIFNEAVGDEFLALAVIDESGKRVDHHDPKLDFTDRSHLRATVSKLSPGRYTVRYRVLSADGHVVSGKYFFNVHGK